MTLPAKERRRLNAMMAYEHQARERGFLRVAGVDEQGGVHLLAPL